MAVHPLRKILSLQSVLVAVLPFALTAILGAIWLFPHFKSDMESPQIQIAAGEPLGFEQGELLSSGHAIECRINAEDPEHNFRPSPGTITTFHMPGGPGIRVDTHAYAGYRIPPYYDSLLAKLISFGRTRKEALVRMVRALQEFIIEGVPTTIPFHLKALQHANARRLVLRADYFLGRLRQRYHQ